MPQYQPDLTTVAAGFELLPDGVYEFKIGPPKPWEKNDPDKGLSHGVRYLLEVRELLEGEDASLVKGKKSIFTCRCHDDIGMSFSKQFVMAALGYSGKEEAKFNEDMKEADWSYDTEDLSVGDIWEAVAGKIVVATLGTRPNLKDPDHEGFQDFTWSAAGEAAA